MTMRGCLLSYSQAEPGRELTQPSPRLLAEPYTADVICEWSRRRRRHHRHSIFHFPERCQIPQRGANELPKEDHSPLECVYYRENSVIDHKFNLSLVKSMRFTQL